MKTRWEHYCETRRRQNQFASLDHWGWWKVNVLSVAIGLTFFAILQFLKYLLDWLSQLGVR